MESSSSIIGQFQCVINSFIFIHHQPATVTFTLIHSEEEAEILKILLRLFTRPARRWMDGSGIGKVTVSTIPLPCILCKCSSYEAEISLMHIQFEPPRVCKILQLLSVTYHQETAPQRDTICGGGGANRNDQLSPTITTKCNRRVLKINSSCTFAINRLHNHHRHRHMQRHVTMFACSSLYNLNAPRRCSIPKLGIAIDPKDSRLFTFSIKCRG